MDYDVMKAVEYSELPTKFRKENTLACLLERGWLVQAKYDGCYGRATIRKDGSVSMQSRTGKDYSTSCANILDELREVFFNPKEDVVLLGEVWSSGASFPEISGEYRSQVKSDKLGFMLFDNISESIRSNAYSIRLASVSDLWGKYIMSANLHTPDSSLGLPEILGVIAAQPGLDGIMLRDPNAAFTPGRALKGEIIKVKPTKSLDLIVIGVQQSLGEKTGRLVWTITVVYRGWITAVGSGVPHIADEVPKVGDIVEIEFLKVTNSGRLREPRFKGIRFDKTEPDE